MATHAGPPLVDAVGVNKLRGHRLNLGFLPVNSTHRAFCTSPLRPVRVVLALILYALVTVSLIAAETPPAAAASRSGPRLQLVPLQAAPAVDGVSVELQFPLGPNFRPGCRLPVELWIQSSAERRLRLGVVPELWQVDAQTGAFDPKAPPSVDFTRATGGSWSGPIRGGAVTGAGTAEQAVRLLPVIDDSHRHLVVVALDDATGQTGKVLWRGDLSTYLHELAPSERLIVRGHATADWRSDANAGAGAGSDAGNVGAGSAATAVTAEIPTTLTLPDQSTATPMLVDAWVGDFPSQVAAWATVDLVLLEDRCFNPISRSALPGRPPASEPGGVLSLAQELALEAWLTQGGRLIGVEPNVTERLHAPVWICSILAETARPTSGGIPLGVKSAKPFRGSGMPGGGITGGPWTSPANQLKEMGLPDAACEQFPCVPIRVGFGQVQLVWPEPIPANPELDGAPPVVSDAEAGRARLVWEQVLIAALAAREPRMMPRQRIDADACTQVFDPQTTQIPTRLIGQIWWFLAAVSAGLLVVVVSVARHSRRTRQTAAALASTPSLASATAPLSPTDVAVAAARAVAQVRTQWAAWLIGAAALLVVAGVASLYGARSRFSAIEWRIRFQAADGRACDERFTYLYALRSVSGVRLEPRRELAKGVFSSATDLIDALPLTATQRDIALEPGRLDATGAAALEGFSLESYRPLLLRSRWLSAPGANGWGYDASSTNAITAVDANTAPELTLTADAAALRAASDWAIVLNGYPASSPPPHLATDHTGWVWRTESNATAAAANAAHKTDSPPALEPLWLHGEQVNLPVALAPQQDLYKAGSLKWLFTQIRRVTRAPVLILFSRRAITQSSWQIGQATLTPVALDDSMQITVIELAEKSE